MNRVNPKPNKVPAAKIRGLCETRHVKLEYYLRECGMPLMAEFEAHGRNDYKRWKKYYETFNVQMPYTERQFRHEWIKIRHNLQIVLYTYPYPEKDGNRYRTAYILVGPEYNRNGAILDIVKVRKKAMLTARNREGYFINFGECPKNKFLLLWYLTTKYKLLLEMAGYWPCEKEKVADATKLAQTTSERIS